MKSAFSEWPVQKANHMQIRASLAGDTRPGWERKANRSGQSILTAASHFAAVNSMPCAPGATQWPVNTISI